MVGFGVSFGGFGGFWHVGGSFGGFLGGLGVVWGVFGAFWHVGGGFGGDLGDFVTALLFKMEEANLASRAKAQELIQATNQVGTPNLGGHPEGTPKLGGGDTGTPKLRWDSGKRDGDPQKEQDSEGRGDSDKYLQKLHTQERAVEEVKLAIKPFYQRKDISKDEYKDILRKAVHKICHSRSGEINPVKVTRLVSAYVQRYKYFRKRGRRGGAPQPPEEPQNPPGPPKSPGGPAPPALPLPPL
uniref:SFR19-like C-terminal domain-containing protein n=1 Tax=Taeniopygia guttata TaxID=59729 RepID=A0A674GRN3_TAEGU